MRRSTSIYLDLVRFLMAAVVFCSHIAKQKYSDGFMWQLSSYGYGENAVDVFFVLSGFVISYVTVNRERTIRDYFTNRAARIYSVAIPALILTISLDAIGRQLVPDIYYDSIPGDPAAPFWTIVLNSLFFCNQVWFNNQSMGANGPFWSLAFEVWYYIIFAVIFFVRRPLGYMLAILIVVFVGPKIAVLFPLWLLGVACHRLTKEFELNTVIGLLLTFVPLIIFAICKKFGMAGSSPYDQLVLSTAFFARVGADYTTGICFAVHLLGIVSIAPILEKTLIAIERPIRWLAGRTFSLYLFHFPILNALSMTLPWPHSSWVTRISILVIPPVIVFLLAEITEQRKDEWRRVFATLTRGSSDQIVAR